MSCLYSSLIGCFLTCWDRFLGIYLHHAGAWSSAKVCLVFRTPDGISGIRLDCAMEESTFSGGFMIFHNHMSDLLPIKSICEFGVVCVVFDQFVEHPGSHSRADPLTSMNSTEERFCKKIFFFKFIWFQNLSIHMAGLLPQPPLQTYENSIYFLLNLRPFKTFITIMS